MGTFTPVSCRGRCGELGWGRAGFPWSFVVPQLLASPSQMHIYLRGEDRPVQGQGPEKPALVAAAGVCPMLSGHRLSQQEGRLYPCKGQLPLQGQQTCFSWSALPGALHQHLSCRTRNPWGTGTALSSSLHPLSTQQVLGQTTRDLDTGQHGRCSAPHAPGTLS